MRNSLLLASVLVFSAGTCFATDTAKLNDWRQQFDSIEALQEADPTEAFAQMEVLANAGFPKAQDRMGYYYRFGVGTPRDLSQAKHWYEKAVAGARDYALGPLARVEAELGNGDAAYKYLVRGVAKNMPGTVRQMGFAHIDRTLGQFSDPSTGLTMLEDLAAAGDIKVARPLLSRYNWRRLPFPAPIAIVEEVEAAGLAGSSRDAETALTYLTLLSDKSPEVTARRAALLQVPGIRGRFKSSEEIILSHDTNSADFRDNAAKILSETDPPDYARAAFTVHQLDNNAFLMILQTELTKRGYNSGPSDGLLGAKTIKAITHFCIDHEILDVCKHGPRKSAAVKAIAAKISETSDLY
ncbi:MAG: hypothetical protein AAFQ66_15355 [Pseudomonadota bacterium]